MDDQILHPPLAEFRHLLSARVLHVLTRNGFSSAADVQQAHDLGTLWDVRGIGSAALLEIKLALGSLPPDATAPPAITSLSPLAEGASALSGRELTLILALAESGHAHRIYADELSRNEALAALGHLRQLAGEDEVGDLYPDGPDNDPWPPEPKQHTVAVEDSRTIVKDTTPPAAPRAVPEPVDDSYEGYVLEPPPGWGQF